MKRRTAVNLCIVGASFCAVALAVLLYGCSFNTPKAVMQRSVTTITVIESDNMPRRVQGRAMQAGDKRLIILSEYPYCLQHEVRHCLEGQWHGDQPNDEDCF